MKNLALFFMFLGMSFYCLAINAPIVTITPDTLNGAGIVQIDITIDNPLNTFLQGEIEIYNPDAEYPPLGMYSYFNDYDLSNGKYVVEFDIPVYATPGNWYVEYIILDYEDSTFTFYSVEINAGFYAINVAPDTIPPKITYFNVSKELAYPGDIVTIEVQIEDDYTGLNHFYIEISHPDYGNVFFEEMFYLDQEKNKSFTINYKIGKYEIPGSRSIYVSLSDDGWNYVELNEDSLDFNLTVEGTILDINPPILISATYIEDNKNYLELVISDNISGVDYFDGGVFYDNSGMGYYFERDYFTQVNDSVFRWELSEEHNYDPPGGYINIVIYDLAQNVITYENFDLQYSNEVTNTGKLSLNANIRLYPNPVSEIINIDCQFNIEGIALYDLNGNIILYKTGNSNKTNVDGLEKGIYILQVETDKATINKKIVIK